MCTLLTILGINLTFSMLTLTLLYHLLVFPLLNLFVIFRPLALSYSWICQMAPWIWTLVAMFSLLTLQGKTQTTKTKYWRFPPPPENLITTLQSISLELFLGTPPPSPGHKNVQSSCYVHDLDLLEKKCCWLSADSMHQPWESCSQSP